MKSNSGSGQKTEGPLSGITVLDFSRAMSGPFCTMILGDLGADVIKVESEKGDETRAWRPPEVKGVSSYFISVNRNKRSIAIDLRKAEARDIVGRLISDSDVIVENFRPGVAERLSIDYESAKAINDDIVYCSISGYGRTGPYSSRPGFDLTILASSGLMSLTGEPEGAPVKFGVPITDITSGLFASTAILSALFHRGRTGEGQYIDMSMLDCNLLTLTHQAAAYFATGRNPERLGSAHSSIAPYQVFSTSDGYLAIAVGSEKLWASFCSAIGSPELAEDALLKSNSERVRNRQYMLKRIEAVFSSRTTAELLSRLESAGVPAARINSVSEALENEQVAERGMIAEITHSSYGRIKTVGSPFNMSRTPGTVRSAPPLLGEQSGIILSQMGYSQAEIQRLQAKGVIFLP
ncbi:MAG: CoA transferase [Candidatus Thermoplasmatota archaeon]|nr:CoA transferase [Candidatus Sysuiplasma jiujiangense]MBX8639148.1 CoA transferase [Candidatus Sysuiplasma jiujiangense]MCL4317851.1 CoA transferase [Candidatus Thermoplasmatota archaeon]MCL5254280.1 CoA transferase [Candidatus Thermoplasmatota archaeon]